MRVLAVFLALLLSLDARADKWLPYTDGRVGGCWLNVAGVLYGCTPQPPVNIQPAPESHDREDPLVIMRGPSQAEIENAAQDLLVRQRNAQIRSISVWPEHEPWCRRVLAQNGIKFISGGTCRNLSTSQLIYCPPCDARYRDAVLAEMMEEERIAANQRRTQAASEESQNAKSRADHWISMVEACKRRSDIDPGSIILERPESCWFIGSEDEWDRCDTPCPPKR